MKNKLCFYIRKQRDLVEEQENIVKKNKSILKYWRLQVLLNEK